MNCLSTCILGLNIFWFTDTLQIWNYHINLWNLFFPYLDILDLYLPYQCRRFNFLENDNPAGTISPLSNRQFVYLCNSSNVRLRFNNVYMPLFLLLILRRFMLVRHKS